MNISFNLFEINMNDSFFISLFGIGRWETEKSLLSFFCGHGEMWFCIAFKPFSLSDHIERKRRKYKTGNKLSEKDIGHNLRAWELIQGDMDCIDWGGPDGEMYLSGGVSVCGSAYAIMTGQIAPPWGCGCDYPEECEECKPYNDYQKKVMASKRPQECEGSSNERSE